MHTYHRPAVTGIVVNIWLTEVCMCVCLSYNRGICACVIICHYLSYYRIAGNSVKFFRSRMSPKNEISQNGCGGL